MATNTIEVTASIENTPEEMKEILELPNQPKTQDAKKVLEEKTDSVSKDIKELAGPSGLKDIAFEEDLQVLETIERDSLITAEEAEAEEERREEISRRKLARKLRNCIRCKPSYICFYIWWFLAVAPIALLGGFFMSHLLPKPYGVAVGSFTLVVSFILVMALAVRSIIRNCCSKCCSRCCARCCKTNEPQAIEQEQMQEQES